MHASNGPTVEGGAIPATPCTTLIEPADGARLGDAPEFRWSAGCDAVRVEIAPTADFVLAETWFYGSTAETTYGPSAALWGAIQAQVAGKAYWRVVGSRDGVVSVTPPFQFRLTTRGTARVAAPEACSTSLYEPADGEQIDPGSRPRFTWINNCAASAIDFAPNPEFALAETLRFGAFEGGQFWPRTVTWNEIVARFPSGGYWRVVGGSRDQESPSQARRFEISQEGSGVDWPLRLSREGDFLEDQSGVPFLMIGDSAWDMPVRLSPAQVATYLDDRKAKGFTTIVIRAMSPAEFGGPRNYAGHAPFVTGEGDWSIPNELYWEHVDRILEEAEQRGLVVLVFPAYLGWRCGPQGWCQQMIAQTDADMAAFGTWLGRRYADQGNVVWAHGGDADCSAHAGACSRVDALASALADALGGGLHTARSVPDRSALDDYAESWLNINSTYAYSDPAAEVRYDYRRPAALPFTYQEGAYENEHDSTPLTWQSQAFSAYLGGAYLGHYFGACPMWNFGARPDWCDDTAVLWEEQLDGPGSRIMSNIGRLMRSRAWHSLVPDYDDVVVTSDKGSALRYHATARVTNGQTVVVWCPDTRSVTVAMSKVSGNQAKAWWYDPDDNSAKAIGTFSTTGSRTFTPPRGRLVLVLDDASASLPVPGGTVE